MKLKWRGLQFEHYILGILLAVEWIMSFTFLGYIHIPPISITTAHILLFVKGGESLFNANVFSVNM